MKKNFPFTFPLEFSDVSKLLFHLYTTSASPKKKKKKKKKEQAENHFCGWNALGPETGAFLPLCCSGSWHNKDRQRQPTEAERSGESRPGHHSCQISASSREKLVVIEQVTTIQCNHTHPGISTGVTTSSLTGSLSPPH
jgi:hypothetical protein